MAVGDEEPTTYLRAVALPGVTCELLYHRLARKELITT